MKMTPEVSKILRDARKRVAKVATYHETLTDAVIAVNDAVDAAGLVLDPDETGGLFCGESGRAFWPIRNAGCGVVFTWHRMPSGRYEQVSYIS